jgi:hypothetical protein
VSNLLIRLSIVFFTEFLVSGLSFKSCRASLTHCLDQSFTFIFFISSDISHAVFAISFFTLLYNVCGFLDFHNFWSLIIFIASFSCCDSCCSCVVPNNHLFVVVLHSAIALSFHALLVSCTNQANCLFSFNVLAVALKPHIPPNTHHTTAHPSASFHVALLSSNHLAYISAANAHSQAPNAVPANHHTKLLLVTTHNVLAQAQAAHHIGAVNAVAHAICQLFLPTVQILLLASSSVNMLQYVDGIHCSFLTASDC